MKKKITKTLSLLLLFPCLLLTACNKESKPQTTPSKPLIPATIPSKPITPATIPSTPITPATIPSTPIVPATIPSTPLTPAENRADNLLRYFIIWDHNMKHPWDKWTNENCKITFMYDKEELIKYENIHGYKRLKVSFHYFQWDIQVNGVNNYWFSKYVFIDALSTPLEYYFDIST